MSLDDQLDEKAADLRNFQAEPAAKPEILGAGPAGKNSRLSRNDIIIVIVFGIAVFAAIYYAALQKKGPGSLTPVSLPVCLKGQPMLLNHPCVDKPATAR